MIQSIIDQDRLVALIKHTPSVEEICALVSYAHDTPARTRIIGLTVPLAFQEKSEAMDVLRRDWQPIGQLKFLLNISNDHLRIHEDERVRRMRSGVGN